MVAYKLMSIRKNGTLASLFINRGEVIPLNEWLAAEFHRTKGFAPRAGWHCTLKPVAPHLVLEPKSGLPRVWVEVDLCGDIQEYDRPESQGGTWLLAESMKVLRTLTGEEVDAINQNS